jgi:hypothetical protein
MINFKELDKFIMTGDIMTLVIMVDGKELGALSFKLDTLAFKAVLEVAKTADVKIPDKIKTEPAKTTKKPDVPKETKPILTDNMDEPEPEPLDDDESPFIDDVDTDTGEIKEPEPPKKELAKPAAAKTTTAKAKAPEPAPSTSLTGNIEVTEDDEW